MPSERSHSPPARSSAHRFAGTRAAGAPRQQWSLAIFGRLVLGAVVLAVLLVGAGLLLTHASDSWTHADGALDRWFVAHRMNTWNRITFVGSDMAKTTTAAAVAAVAFFALRVWLAALVRVAGAGRCLGRGGPHLPDRHRHSAASAARRDPSRSGTPDVEFPVWPYRRRGGGVRLPRLRYLALHGAPMVGGLVCVLLIAVPLAVGMSRLYRGAHYPSDVIGGAVLGVVWLSFVVLTLMPKSLDAQQPSTSS